jgi:DNA-binding IscR family transcriptional regulator
MQISTKFTIAVHILAASEYFKGSHKITSQFLAGSIGSNPVIIRNIMLQLQEAGIISVKRGPGGIMINRPLSEITYLDIYRAVETNSGDNLFRFHENPNPECPVGKTIHGALDHSLTEIQSEFEKVLASYNMQQVYENIEAAEKQQKKK